jgi:hypothetical protein
MKPLILMIMLSLLSTFSYDVCAQDMIDQDTDTDEVPTPTPAPQNTYCSTNSSNPTIGYCECANSTLTRFTTTVCERDSNNFTIGDVDDTTDSECPQGTTAQIGYYCAIPCADNLFWTNAPSLPAQCETAATICGRISYTVSSEGDSCSTLTCSRGQSENVGVYTTGQWLSYGSISTSSRIKTCKDTVCGSNTSLNTNDNSCKCNSTYSSDGAPSGVADIVAEGVACKKISCPSNSTLSGYTCTCNPGYTSNGSGTCSSTSDCQGNQIMQLNRSTGTHMCMDCPSNTEPDSEHRFCVDSDDDYKDYDNQHSSADVKYEDSGYSGGATKTN